MKKKLVILSLSVIVVAIFLRFFRVESLFIFSMDEEYQANLAWWLVKDLKPLWIGVSASDTGFYLGPGFTYLNYFLFLISKGDPVILGYFSVLMSGATLVSLWWIVKKWFGLKAALLATVIYGFSQSVIVSDLRFWNPSLIPFLSLWFLYSLYEIKNNVRMIILTSFLLSVSLHVHLSLLTYLPIFLVVIFQNYKKLKIGTVFLSIFAFIPGIIPLVIYDINHNFDNLLTPIRLIKKVGQSGSIASFMPKMATFFSSIHDLLFPNYSLISTSAVIILLSIIILRIKRAQQNNDKFLISVATIYLMATLVFPGSIQEYYYLGLTPVIAIIIAITLKSTPITLVLPLVLMFLMVNISSFLTRPVDRGLMVRKKMVQEISLVVDHPFELISYPSYRAESGWRYLFSAYGKLPAKSDADTHFGWIYQDEISSEDPQLQVYVSSSPIEFLSQGTHLVSGIYHAYIIDKTY